MARLMNKLSAREVDKKTAPGLYGDGGGLTLQITKAGVKSWLFRYMVEGKARAMGLGPTHTITLAKARQKATEAREKLIDGIDPLDDKAQRKCAERLAKARHMTFDQCASAYIEAHRPSWKNAKHADQWTNTIATYVSPIIGSLPVADVDTTLIVKVLTQREGKGAPFWESKSETASRVRGRIESVLGWATTSGLRSGDNPARWKGHLDNLLATISKAQRTESLAAHGKLGEAAVAATKTLPARGVIAAGRGMIQAYQAEDSVFRLAKFLQEVDAGATDMEAGKAAKEAFLDYNINAPWIRTMRRTALPFISFTYRAAPLLVKNMATKPWKFAKYMGLGYGLSLLAYGMLGADAEEEKERRLLPEEMQGTSILGLPKMVRMPWNDKDGDPVWLDVRRWLPGADIAELNNEQSALPLPPWLSAGGPLALAVDLFSNTNRFGDKIVQETDTATQVAEKVADHIFKWAAPNLPLPGPGSALRAAGADIDQGSLDPYAWVSLERSYSGAKTIAGNTKDLNLVVPNVLGVKLQGRRLQDELANLGFEYQAKEREIKTNISRIGRQGAAQRISSEEMQRKIKDEVEKLQELGRERGERMRP